jgi:uncharacterized protein (TIGR02678 family)
LLRNPLLLAGGDTAEEYILIRRHSVWLKHWLAKFPAWSLHIDNEVARLRKLPPDLLDETRQAVDGASGTVFSRRRYALLCLALAALEQSDRQTSLRQIAESIVQYASTDPQLSRHGIVFDIGNYDQRRDLIHSIRLLMDKGVLRRLDGDERQFLNRSVSADVSYEINRPVLAAMLNVSRSASAFERTPSTEDSPLERATGLIDEPMPATEKARNRRIRSRLVRILLDDPILYFDALNEEERIYLELHRSYLLSHIYQATGLLAEVRREGIAMVDDLGDLIDVRLPEESTDGHLSLLVVEWLAEFSREHAGETVPLSMVEQHVRTLIRVHGFRWRKEVREPGAEAQLTEDMLLRLRALRLIRLTAGGVVPLPACGRYAACNSINGPAHEDN